MSIVIKIHDARYRINVPSGGIKHIIRGRQGWFVENNSRKPAAGQISPARACHMAAILGQLPQAVAWDLLIREADRLHAHNQKVAAS